MADQDDLIEENNNSSQPVEENDDPEMLEDIYLKVVKKWYKTLFMWIIFFVAYIFISQLNWFFNYSILTNSSTISALSETSKFIEWSQSEWAEQLKQTRENIINSYNSELSKVFSANWGAINWIYCIDIDWYMQSLTSFNNNTIWLTKIIKQNSWNEKIEISNLENSITALLLMSYEACGDVDPFLYVADMSSLSNNKVSTSIVNIKIPLWYWNENLASNLFLFAKKRWLISPSDENSRLFKISKEVEWKDWLWIYNENIFLELPVKIIKIANQTISSDYLSPNKLVQWINIPFIWNKLTWLWLFWFFWSLKFALSWFLYSFPITSSIFTWYIFLILVLIYLWILLLLVELFPLLLFIYRNKKIRDWIFKFFDVAIKFCYNVMIVMLAITILSNMILPIFLILF